LLLLPSPLEAEKKHQRTDSHKLNSPALLTELYRYLGVDHDTIKGHLPTNPVSYEHYENAPPGFKGWAGYIKSEKDIEGLVELMKLGGEQEPSG
jgi:hypothetical protein